MNNLLNSELVPKSRTQLALDNTRWYALYTRSRFEKKVYNDLLKSRHTAFLPLVKEYHNWSDRVKSVMVPLLPSYVFVKASPIEVKRAAYMDGVVRLVCSQGKPCEIREEEIHLLEGIVRHGFKAQCGGVAGCRVGDLVRIVRGPMKGWEGRVELCCGQSRVVFQIESLRQAISVEVGVGDLEKL